MADDTPLLLFGACDRHNFGDLLFPHIAAALLPGRRLIHAGLAARDLRPYGGHQTRAIAPLALELRDQPLHILHVGGELLTCDAWQAAVMLQTPEQAQEMIARCEHDPAQRRAWAARTLGLGDEAPYCIARELFPAAKPVSYCAVGGVELADRPAELRREVLAKLHAADGVGVRDKVTHAHLAAAGIAAILLPDPAVMVRELFDAEIQRHARHGEAAQVRAAFPQGYLAVQFSADFGDDATLRIIAAQLDAIARASGFTIVLFRAGAAPWHDDLACYRRLAAWMHAPAIWLFSSLHLWDICALIAHSRGYCGSSLHGRIVAMAHGLPRINVRQPAPTEIPAKQKAYCASWELPGLPVQVAAGEIAAAWSAASAVPQAMLRQHAAEMAQEYRGCFAALAAGLA
ncbi:polysaccharide pyruvyl transferase family protein [Sulfurivermis fontis]|uniref:polysaccharide pyruvyl transferase family protein n=1 Tax=Sulfurivermis fontis TaxID=1972068 RepID=UPI000FDA748E|nr:polysaccharide pyruvyl transferase family protein [Sulfurivermis fontis]